MAFEWWKRVPTSIFLFLFFLTVYWFTLSGRLQYGGEMEKYRVAQSIVERCSFSIRPIATRNEIGVSGQSYSVYEIGQTLLQVPFYALGRVLFNLFTLPDVNWITFLTVGLLNPVITALTCIVLFKTVASLGFGKRTALLLALLFGLGTIAWPYSRGFDREPLLGLLILLSFYMVYLFRKTSALPWLFLAGVVTGYLVFTKFIQALIIPFFLVYILAIILQRNRQASASARGPAMEIALYLGIFILPTLFFVGAQVTYALTRFGTVFGGIGGSRFNLLQVIQAELQLSQPIAAIIGLLFSGERSIFFYSPPTILFLAAWIPWFKRQRAEALFLLGLILSEFFAAATRFEWWGGPRWGPRYLVQITPLLIIPLAVLETYHPSLRRIWVILGGLALCAGVVIQGVGTLTNERDFVDITGKHLSFFGQLDFLAHGALDSLVISASPTGLPPQVNPFGVLLIVAGLLLGLALVARIRDGVTVPPSPRVGWFVLALVLLVEFAAFVAWIVAPYPRILAAQGDTRYVAGNNFLAEGRKCEATKMYLIALERETNFQRQALARLDELLPRARGEAITADDLLTQVEMSNEASVTKDRADTLFGNGALKLDLPAGRDATIIATSSPLVVQPSVAYTLSGWLKTTNIYGTGTASISVYEDDGTWRHPRTTDLAASDETHGWQPFAKSFTTLPTTQRIIVKASLWNTYGTVWIDGLTLGQGTAPANPPCR